MPDRIIILCFFGILISQNVLSQRFYRHYNEFKGEIRNIHPLQNGEFLLTGDYFFNSLVQFPDVFWLKVDSLGNPLGEPFYWGSDSLEGSFITRVLSDQKFVSVRNVSSNSGQANFYMNTCFTVSDFVGNLGASVCIDGKMNEYSSGNFLILNDSTFMVINTINQDVQLTKLNVSGEILFQKVYATDSSEVAVSLVSDLNDGFYISGEQYEGPSDFLDVLLMHVDYSGELIWKKVLPAGFNNHHSIMLKDDSDNLYLVGHMEIMSSMTKDLQVIKCSPSGEITWLATLDQPDHDLVPLDAFYSNGSIYVTGLSGNPILGGSESNFPQILMAKIDDTGTYLWQHQITDNQVEGGYSGKGMCIVGTLNDEIAIGGSYFDGSHHQLLLVKTNLEGEYANVEETCIAIVAYPNPFGDSFTINIGPRELTGIQFYDMLGNELSADYTLLDDLITITPGQWSTGLIELRLSFANAPDFSMKLIKH